MRSRLVASLGLALLILSLAPPAAATGVPDPSRSSCTFPTDTTLPCPDPITVSATILDAFDTPVANCSATLTILVDSGFLNPAQVTTLNGVTDANGLVVFVFPDGILGSATIRLRVTTTCVGNIIICDSPVYNVECVDPTHINQQTWGAVKGTYQ